ncbi:MAG: LLM class flavin-dependent oxidoreductase [Pseudonocardiales bacterium]|nr:LLM class flavin-dependent oxidoreductase [Hyphomicrobiales bacterium]MBV8825498.1 LLM class flavin-dependent oxidoreductase [Hyphomicrobiales bacterium]MBV9429424.1 LLM class flavin-dependent oxidoreductase [Bradyrhizobiaceae bacterium]MBV9728092.1 LLM class flavin-dependent oxidoreductase [Pseudonocardiales bacterium]
MKHVIPVSPSFQPPIRNENKLKLGLFGPNCSGGLAPTTVPERWRNTWENNLALARMADDAGLEFLLPIARWIGYGGKTDFHGSVLDSMTWAAGLLASTKHINIFATVHTAVHHPVVIAKQIATLDQIGNGRVGLNVVVGWNPPEFQALGISLPVDRTSRYTLGQEWLDIVVKLWYGPGPFDWNGQHYQLQRVYSEPRPIVSPIPIFNAAISAEGREFAIRNAEYLFTAAIDLRTAREDIRALKANADKLGRRAGALTFCYVVCRPSAKEATEYHRYYAQQHTDHDAVDRLIDTMLPHSKTLPATVQAIIRNNFAGGHGGRALIGDPDMVADGLEAISATGFDGTTLAFVDYAGEFPYFRDEVIPRLERRGLRRPFRPHIDGNSAAAATRQCATYQTA